jgi:AraC-like DNA-binding protein/ligand-binding sensor protein
MPAVTTRRTFPIKDPMPLARSATQNNIGGVVDTTEKALIEKLTRSKIYKDYEQAFRGATGLPLAFTPTETWGLPHHGDRNENPFCAEIATSSKACAGCLELQQRLSREHNGEPIMVKCFAGLCDAAVPVRLGDRVLGFLRTGQVLTDRPSEADFDRASLQLMKWGADVDLKQLRDAYFASKVLTTEQYSSFVRLLKVFADHISMVSNQILVREENTENPMITRAKTFIEDNQAEDLSLATVARAVNTSTFYFCKMFKKATGLTFTEYLGRVRVEKAKSLLLSPHARVSEVAFEVGFQSLSQFNRVFKRITGLSPTEYRARLPKTPAIATPGRR